MDRLLQVGEHTHIPSNNLFLHENVVKDFNTKCNVNILAILLDLYCTLVIPYQRENKTFLNSTVDNKYDTNKLNRLSSPFIYCFAKPFLTLLHE